MYIVIQKTPIVKFLKKPKATIQERNSRTLKEVILLVLLIDFFAVFIYRVLNLVFLNIFENYAILHQSKTKISNSNFSYWQVLILLSLLNFQASLLSL